MIFLSTGHHKTDPGALNKTLNLQEHRVCSEIVDLMFRINKKVPNVLEMTRVPEEPLSEKVSFINQRCNVINDIAVEIHLNSAEDHRANGTETWHYPGSKGETLANAIQQCMLEILPFRDRGIKDTTTYFFLKKTIIPAVIVEVLFICNDIEASYLLHPNGKLMIARSILAGLRYYYMMT